MKRTFFIVLCLIFAGNSIFVESNFVSAEHSYKSHRLKKTKKLKKRKNKKFKKKIAFSAKNS